MPIRPPAALLVPPFVAATLFGQQWVPIGGVRFQARNAVHDPVRDRVLVFTPDACLWEIDGDAALLRGRPGTGAWPGARTRAGLAFDSRRGELVLFGGWNARNTFGDTWIWNGESWRQAFSITQPTRRFDASMVFDPVRDRIVLYGGGTAEDVLWEWDGAQWTEQTPATAVRPNGSPMLYWDPTRSRVTLLVSETGFTTSAYQWDGIDWRLQPRIGAAPPILVRALGAYDPLRDRFVVIGGSLTGLPGTIQEWDGSRWSTAGSFPPAARADGDCWFDPRRGLVTFAGGAWGQLLDHRTWTWDGAQVQEVVAATAPPEPREFAWFWDGAAGAVRMYGGSVGYPYAGALWSWDGLRWRATALTDGPLQLGRAAVASDLRGGRGLAFGGFNDSALFWSCAGGVWQQLPGGPPGRTYGALAVDERRGAAVLFGGSSGTTDLGDTWEFANGAWAQRTTPVAPAPRQRTAMAFDAARGRIVLFGGSARLPTGQRVFADTWEWDGVQWTNVTTASSPPACAAPSLAFDPVSNRTILAAYVETGGIGREETWSYDGVDWTIETIFAAAEPSQLALDARRGRLVAIDTHGNLRERTPAPATAAALGAGCGAPAPQLAARTLPRVGEPEFGLEATVAGPGQPVLFALATAPAPTPGTGCALWIGAPAGVALQLANGNGLAVQRIPLPLQPALRGLRVLAQAATLDPAQGPLLTRALAITCGD